VTAKKRRKDDAAKPEQHPQVEKRFRQDDADKEFYRRFTESGGFAKWRGNRPKP